MLIVVIDGMGGGIGRSIVERLVELNRSDIEVIALGTNSQATLSMLKAGASQGATGENAIVHMSDAADVIIGPLAIISANAMLGEISPAIAQAVGSSSARKLLIPISRCRIDIVGVRQVPLKELLDEMIKIL